MTRPTRPVRPLLLLVGLIAVIAAGLHLGHAPAAAPARLAATAMAPRASGSASAPSLPSLAAHPDDHGAAPHLADLAPADPPGSDYAPRPATEWLGRRVDRATQPLCDGADSCGLAMACIDGRCAPCGASSPCASGETCVLDHCVLATEAACHSRADCPDDTLCVLSGYSADPRGNAAMRSVCLASSGGTDRAESLAPATDPGPATPMPIPAQSLLDLVESDLAASP
jgi:hypothetical protein